MVGRLPRNLMMSFLFWTGLCWTGLFCAGSPAFGADAVAAQPPRTVAELKCFSGRYPHLAVFNDNAECGIGAVVPWAGKLWVVTYAPHAPRGGDDKLYEIDPRLRIEARPESIGGTPANRLIHRESNQLFIGPYCIDADGNVRVIPYTKALGRPTATARHLSDPANKVYTFTMEEGLYEIDVHSLEVKTIHKDMHAEGAVDYLPGYHGKGGYTGQGRLVVANNGYKGKDRDVSFYDFAGCLAEWDGRCWKVLEEKPILRGDRTGWNLREFPRHRPGLGDRMGTCVRCCCGCSTGERGTPIVFQSPTIRT